MKFSGKNVGQNTQLFAYYAPPKLSDNAAECQLLIPGLIFAECIDKDA